MHKVYITKRVWISELLGFLMILASLIYMIVLTAIKSEVPLKFKNGVATSYGSPLVLVFFVVVMLFGNLILAAVVHFLPPGVWNMPVKIKEENLVKSFADVAFMIAIIELLMGGFTLAFSLTFQMGDGPILIESFVMVAGMLAAIVWAIVKVVRDNK